MKGTRWVRPFDAPPGWWKKQLPTKFLKLAGQGKLSDLTTLLNTHPDLLNHRGPHGRTFLFEAVRRGRQDIVELLIARGADVSLCGCYNSESLVQLNPLSAARYYKRHEIEEMLVAEGATNDVFRAAFCNETDTVKAILKVNPQSVNFEDPHDQVYYTPVLSFSISGGNEELTSWLIESGADVETYSFQFLFLASMRTSRTTVELLLARGATLDGADARLWMATSNPDILNLLLEHGLSPNQRPYDNNKLYPLAYACRGDKGGNMERVNLLLRSGAVVNQVCTYGRTALHYAARAGFDNVVHALIAAGADTRIEDDNGETAEQIANRFRKDSTYRILHSVR